MISPGADWRPALIELLNSAYIAGAPIPDLAGDDRTSLVIFAGEALDGLSVPSRWTFARMPCSTPSAST